MNAFLLCVLLHAGLIGSTSSAEVFAAATSHGALAAHVQADRNSPIQKDAVPCLPKGDICVPRQDELWLISTRHLCFQCGTDPRSYELDVRRHDEQLGWVDSSLVEFLAQPPAHTVVYVHGNRIEWSEAFQHGWEVYGALAACCPTPERMRFVIWSWPAEQIRGPLRDIRLKADRADNQTKLFGGFLQQLPRTAPLSLIGYSYGSRIITGGLDWYVRSGGNLPVGPTVDSPAPSPLRVALLAAAMDHDWLCAGNCHGEALAAVDDLLILYNSCDPALQRYDLVDRCYRAVALGYVGLPGECAASFPTRIEQLDVCCPVGRSHDEDRYFYSDSVRQEICRVLFAAGM